MASRYITKNGRTSRRGLFVNGVWHCDCDTRLPADKFQTKNGGKNHGRWFYTCQKSQPSRCGFFLWEDEAKVREEGAVLSNSRTEPTSPQTPKKIGTPSRQAKLGAAAQIVTPASKTKSTPKLEAIPPPPSYGNSRDDWSDESVDDADLASALDEFETPRKVARTATITSPSKQARKASDHSDASSITLPHQPHEHGDDDVFTTPSTSRKPPFAALPTPTITPSHPTTPSSNLTHVDSSSSTPLSTSIPALLQPYSLPTSILTELSSLLTKEELRVSGITKGRDITRLAVQAKERRIHELEARIRGLEQEKETMRNVIAHLKSDIATSPKKGRGRGGKAGGGGGGLGSGEVEKGRTAGEGDGGIVGERKADTAAYGAGAGGWSGDGRESRGRGRGGGWKPSVV
jgi:hypothetical protein